MSVWRCPVTAVTDAQRAPVHLPIGEERSRSSDERETIMSILKSRLLSRAVAIALSMVGPSAGAGALVLASASPAMAVCRYGSPNCVNPRPNFDFVYQAPQTLEGAIDEWINQDCAYYNNCGAPPQDDNDEEEDDEAEDRAAPALRNLIAPRTGLRVIRPRR